MDRVSKLTRPQVLKELQNYKEYKFLTQKEIADQLGGIANLRTELSRLESTNLSKKSKSSSPRKSLTVEKGETKVNAVDTILPNDVLKEIYSKSDTSTKMKMCATSTQNKSLCTKEFYNAMIDARKNASTMIKIIETFNKYKGEAIIRLWYHEIKNKIHPDILKLVNSRYLTFNNAIDFTYSNKKWSMNLNQDSEIITITPSFLLTILTEEIYNKQHGKDVHFVDFDQNQLLYSELLQNAKKNKPIPRAYLMAYELLM